MPQNQSKQKITLSLFAGFVFMFVISCQYEFIVPEEIEIDPNDPISFSEDIIPIFNDKCNNSSCHRAGFGVLDLSPDNAYADLQVKNQIDVDNPESSQLYVKLIEAGGTHQGRSTATERATILEWIKQGALNN